METHNAPARPLMRGWLHAVAATAVVPAGLVLASDVRQTAHRVAALVFAFGVLVSFGVSAIYHCLARSDAARALWRRLDHAGIYVLIAASYVPLCVVVVPRGVGLPVMVAVGAAAITGAVLQLTAFDRVRVLGGVLYLLLGWSMLILTPQLLEHLDRTEFALLLAGGVLYTVGVPVLARNRPNPWPAVFGYHEIWHALTVLAAAAHFTLTARVV